MADISQQRVATGALVTLAMIAIAGALAYTRTIMIPFLLAVLIVFLLSPLVDLLKRRFRLPHSVTVPISLILAAAALGLVVLLAISSVKGFLQDAEDYSARLELFAREITAFGARFGYDFGGQSLSAIVNKLPMMGFVKGVAGRLVSLVSNGFLIFIFVVFMMVGKREETTETRPDRNPIFGRATTQVRKYLLTKIITSSTTGILVWVLLALVGLDLAFLFGVLAFLLNFIPNVGSIIATLLPLPVAYLQFDSLGMVALALLLPAVVQMTIGNFIEPKLMGQSLGLHPVVILISLMFWGIIWGGVGMVLAVPITAVLKLVFEEIETTRPISQVMEGRLL